jgi:hypothetical protein
MKIHEEVIIIYNEQKYDYIKNKNKLPIFLEGCNLNEYEYGNNEITEKLKIK